MIGEAESKEKYLNADTLSQFNQTIRERVEIVNLINKNSKQIIDEAINNCIQINPPIKKLDIIFRFVTYALVAKNDEVLSAPDLR